jgi:hypothetical protein
VTDEVSPGGSEVIRHEARERDFEPTSGDPVLIEAIDEHITRVFGDRDGRVFHELVSDLVHLDVHVVPPARDRQWTTLVTSGMAERPMTVPESLEDCRYAELVLAVPPDWPLEQEAFEDERVYWPVRLLKDLARLPHEYETFLYYGHTIPNGDPPEPYASNTELCAAFIGMPTLTPDEFDELSLPDGRVVRFWAVFPLQRNELEFKLQVGADALWERFDEAGVTEVLDPERPSVIGRRRRLFGRG